MGDLSPFPRVGGEESTEKCLCSKRTTSQVAGVPARSKVKAGIAFLGWPDPRPCIRLRGTDDRPCRAAVLRDRSFVFVSGHGRPFSAFPTSPAAAREMSNRFRRRLTRVRAAENDRDNPAGLFWPSARGASGAVHVSVVSREGRSHSPRKCLPLIGKLVLGRKFCILTYFTRSFIIVVTATLRNAPCHASCFMIGRRKFLSADAAI